MAYGAYTGAEAATAGYEGELEKQKALQTQKGLVGAKKKQMSAEFQSQLDEAQEKAKKKAKKKGGLFKALKFAGMFLGPAGQAVTGALSGYGQARQQRKAMQELTKGPQFERYKGTFLGDMAQQQLQSAKDMQQSAGASLMSGLMGGIGGFAGGKLLGGGKKFDAASGAQTGGSAMSSEFFKGAKGKPFQNLFSNLKTKLDPSQLSTEAGKLAPGGGKEAGGFSKLMDFIGSGKQIADIVDPDEVDIMSLFNSEE